LPWALLVAGSVASLAANVAVAEPSATGRVIAAWPSFSLIDAYELLMRQVRGAACASAPGRSRSSARGAMAVSGGGPAASRNRVVSAYRGAAGRTVQADAWRWAQDNRAEDGSLPSGKDIGRQYGRHERWGRLVKRSGLAGELSA